MLNLLGFALGFIYGLITVIHPKRIAQVRRFHIDLDFVDRIDDRLLYSYQSSDCHNIAQPHIRVNIGVILNLRLANGHLSPTISSSIK